jgi:2-polyprenyl-6-methoxyphenol hydroxylase-like FAD-dependent oxidoreductase
VRYQGNWIPHKLREATEDGVFFVGDSAGHCLPLTAEGIRTALYFGIACGRELREVVAGRQTAAQALRRYGAFSASHKWKFESMLAAQRLVPKVAPRALARALKAMQWEPFVRWSFGHYLNIAPPPSGGQAKPRPVGHHHDRQLAQGAVPAVRSVVPAPVAGGER